MLGLEHRGDEIHTINEKLDEHGEREGVRERTFGGFYFVMGGFLFPHILPFKQTAKNISTQGGGSKGQHSTFFFAVSRDALVQLAFCVLRYL